jgi:transcriptional regulator with XRE-family HTH domain
VIGDALRARRQAQHRTLREVSTAANVSLGYLSEIERGQKEASSELLAAICDALGAALSDVLREVSDTLAITEEMRGVLVPVRDSPDVASQGTAVPAPVSPVQDANVSVAVHRDGPLKTTLRATHRVRGRDVVRAA